MKELGNLAGFADKTQIDVTLTHQIGQLSDSQLEDRMRQAAQRLGIHVPEIQMLELEAVEPQSGETTSLGEGDSSPTEK